MARKNLLQGLMPAELSSDNSAGMPVHPLEHTSASFGQRGAIGAVSRSIERLKSSAIVEIDPDLIDAPIVTDRLEEPDDLFAEFAEQIRENGQQVPILVRPHPEKEGRYQIAYGRRRLRAVKLAGRQVNATVRPLTDEELIIAQGQENSAREDLTYIEKALYARQLEEHGYSRQVIMSAMAADKAAVSHLISTASKIPTDIIRDIGRAPKAGRDRWVKLAALLSEHGAEERARVLLKGELAGTSSDTRFARLFSDLSQRAADDKNKPWRAPDGVIAASIRDGQKTMILEFNKRAAPAFAEYVLEQLPIIYQQFQTNRVRNDPH